MATAPALTNASTGFEIPHDVQLRTARKYDPNPPSTEYFYMPPADYLEGTWWVVHSTLPMWRTATNVSITYERKSSATNQLRIRDTVRSTPNQNAGFMTRFAKCVRGEDRPIGPGWFEWRGSGILFLMRGRWEILGWGQEPDTGERWIVIWFEKIKVADTPEGMDILSDRRDGLSTDLHVKIKNAISALNVLGKDSFAQNWTEVTSNGGAKM